MRLRYTLVSFVTKQQTTATIAITSAHVVFGCAQVMPTMFMTVVLHLVTTTEI